MVEPFLIDVKEHGVKGGDASFYKVALGCLKSFSDTIGVGAWRGGS